MLKRLSGFLILSLILFCSCNNSANKEASQANDTATVAVLTFDTAAHSFVDKPVRISGTVSHICKHGGKRLFLADGNDTILVEVTTGPDIVKFDESLIGSRIKILGFVRELRIDNKYLNEWEAEIMKPAENHQAGVHTGQKGHEDQTSDDKLAQVNAYRDMLKNSGKDHLSFYSIEAVSFQEQK